MADEKPLGAQFEKWLSVGGSIIAPATSAQRPSLLLRVCLVEGAV